MVSINKAPLAIIIFLFITLLIDQLVLKAGDRSRPHSRCGSVYSNM